METDSRGNRFIDVPTDANEFVRATYVPSNQSGYGTDSIRVQIRDATGRLRRGPEIQVKILGDVIKAIIDLAIAP